MTLNEAVDIYQSDCGGECSHEICDCLLEQQIKTVDPIGRQVNGISICKMFDIICESIKETDDN